MKFRRRALMFLTAAAWTISAAAPATCSASSFHLREHSSFTGSDSVERFAH
jgi:hypothetical protein